MPVNHWLAALGFGCLAMALPPGQALAYDPPASSKPLLKGVDFTAAGALDEEYRLQFVACDRGMAGVGPKDHFRGKKLRLAGKPEKKQYYLCSRDPSNVEALLTLKDGGVFWHSKMALDVDGSWAAWNGIPGATDSTETSYKWPGVAGSGSHAAQIDPDRIPFVVMPMNGLEKLTGAASSALGMEFAEKTRLTLGDMGVVIYRDSWTPVLIGDGGPFMRLGEGSSRVFEAIGQKVCKQWSADGLTCVGTGHKAYPYENSGLDRDVLFVLYPNSSASDITPQNAVSKMCAFAKAKLGLSGGGACP
jgi:hypothetical protein